MNTSMPTHDDQITEHDDQITEHDALPHGQHQAPGDGGSRDSAQVTPQEEHGGGHDTAEGQGGGHDRHGTALCSAVGRDRITVRQACRTPHTSCTSLTSP